MRVNCVAAASPCPFSVKPCCGFLCFLFSLSPPKLPRKHYSEYDWHTCIHLIGFWKQKKASLIWQESSAVLNTVLLQSSSRHDAAWCFFFLFFCHMIVIRWCHRSCVSVLLVVTSRISYWTVAAWLCFHITSPPLSPSVHLSTSSVWVT